EVIAKETSSEKRSTMVVSIGQSYINTGDWDMAEKHFKRMLKDGDEKKDKKLQCNALISLGHIAEERGLFDEAMGLFEESLKRAESVADNFNMGAAYAMIGHLQWKLGNYATASVILQKAEQLAKSSGDKSLRGRVLLDLGNVAGDQGNAEMAQQYYKSALSHLEGNDDNLLSIARAYNNLGDTYLRRGDYEKALEYFRRGEESASKYGNDDMRAWALFNISETLAKMGNVDEGEKMLQESEQILIRLNDQLGLANIHHCRGLLSFTRGDKKKALGDYQKALEEFRRLSVPLEQGLTLKDMGMVYLSNGQKPEAQKVLLEAKSIFTNHQVRDEALKVQVLLTESGL
ncbi:MAG: tetratricopeptide repeat protein, partial [Candidatus Thermoplasmatota archaeon]|nr:tetratricopeptide repeat protein [Candidatus Thermoplasmatota archaeon]